MPFVYLHKDINGKIFYVGKASHYSRAYSKKCRNKKWKEVSKNGYSVELIEVEKEHLEELEDFLIEEIEGLVNVKRNSNKKLNYETIDWKSFVEYDETSSTFLRYTVDNDCRNPKYKKYKGDEAGFIRRHNGKILSPRIEHKGASYSISRVVWLLNNGYLTENLVVSHIDCDPINNNISNLELCTRSSNSCRTKTHVHNDTVSNTGQHCITRKEDKLGEYLQVRVRYGEKQFFKLLRTKELGYEKTLEKAILKREEFKMKIKEIQNASI